MQQRVSSFRLFRTLAAADTWLLSVSPRYRYAAIVATFAVIVAVGIRNVPRAYIDFRAIPLLAHISQPETYGTDTIADMYEARVVLNDVRDMYTKGLVEQTPLEAATWSKEASAPYPPVMLLAEAALYALGDGIGVGFYGVMLMLAAVFLCVSAYYCLRTRWYVFPLLYLNFSYLAYRFVYVQDGSYLIMLMVVMSALLLARHKRTSAHVMMALAITLKLSPLYYLKNLPAMPRRVALVFGSILIAGLVAPIGVLDNYLYIFRFQEELKGGTSETIAAVLIAIPFALVLWYVESRLRFDWQDRIGWGLVPFALFLGLKTNTARHLIMVLLIPDRRGVRSLCAAMALALPVLFPAYVRMNSALLISAGLLVIGLVHYLDTIGWDVVRADARRPLQTLKMMMSL